MWPRTDLETCGQYDRGHFRRDEVHEGLEAHFRHRRYRGIEQPNAPVRKLRLLGSGVRTLLLLCR